MAIERQHKTEGLDAPAHLAYAITPNNTTDLPNGDTRAIYVGGAGNIVLVTSGGTEVTLYGASAGTVLPIRVSRIKATNTTATNLIALY